MEFLKTLKVIQRVASREFEEKDQTARALLRAVRGMVSLDPEGTLRLLEETAALIREELEQR